MQTPFIYQKDKNGLCKFFTYYPKTNSSEGHSLISLWTDSDDLVAQPVRIKNSFIDKSIGIKNSSINKISSLQQDNDFFKIVIIDGEKEKHIFAINKRLLCCDFTAKTTEKSYTSTEEPTEKDLRFAKNLEIVNEFIQALHNHPNAHLHIEKIPTNNNTDLKYFCQIVQD